MNPLPRLIVSGVAALLINGLLLAGFVHFQQRPGKAAPNAYQFEVIELPPVTSPRTVALEPVRAVPPTEPLQPRLAEVSPVIAPPLPAPLQSPGVGAPELDLATLLSQPAPVPPRVGTPPRLSSGPQSATVAVPVAVIAAGPLVQSSAVATAAAASAPPGPALLPPARQVLRPAAVALSDLSVISAEPALAAATTEPMGRRIVDPVYPSSLRQRGVEGEVRVKLLIDEAGAVADFEILTFSGSEKFAQAVRRVIRQWRFHPATRNGEPVSTWAVKTCRFSLEG